MLKTQAAVTAANSPTSPGKRILLIDAVVWAPTYPAESPRRDVHHWFARWLTDLPEVTVTRIAAEEISRETGLDGVDGVILSGSPRDAWTEDPVNLALCDFVHSCRRRLLPFLGVCYGHQILARALGGSVGRHPGGLELGNTSVRLTAAGRAAPLLAGLPEEFDVLSSHADAVLTLPPGAELSVQGAFTACQGMTCGPTLWGVQFHPETDPETLRFLWSVRRDLWRPLVRFDLDHVLDHLQPTPIAATILRNFVTRVIP